MSQSAGYSGTPLPRKLGIAAGATVLLAGAPAGFDLGDAARPGSPCSAGAAVRATTSCSRSARTGPRWPPGSRPWKALLGPADALWLAWPKKASGVPTDLTDNVVREVGLAGGLVDVKVCAIDAVWSGLKLVYRLSDRPTVSSTQA